jgi:hypothetical protein
MVVDKIDLKNTKVSEAKSNPLILSIEISILKTFSFFLNSFIHMCIHCLGHFSPLPHSLNFSPITPQFQAGCVLPLALVLLKKRDKHNKEDKAFLLVELRMAIQKYS